ncbi:MAG: LysR family transcriptional regulator [Myxococcales bacterium]|nr:LysR family transcriptional regulator [Myxococcales bacterium]
MTETIARDWNLYRTFLAVARHGTLAAAAAQLESSVSTVHRQLAALEAELDTRLLERRGRGQALTAAGEALVGRAARIEDELAGIARALAGRDQALRGTVVLTTTDTLAHALLTRYLPTLRARLPEVHLHVAVDNRHYRLGRGEADIALRPGGKPREPDVVARELGEVAFGFYAARAYLERRGRPRRKRELARHDAVVVDDSLAHILYGQIARARFDPARWVLRSPSLLVQADAVSAGAGIAALPCFLMDARPGVERLFAPEREGPLWLLYHAELRGAARVRAVVELLREAIVADRPLLAGAASHT